MKVGDTYYCIKDRYNYDCIVNKSGRTYKIIQIREKYNRIVIENERILNSSYAYFYVIKNDGKSWIFSDYFVSLPEYRKMKLKKINESI